MAIIEVVSAVIIHQGRLLFTQRTFNKDFPFQWECPGGKVDAGETHQEALRREVREEIGCEVKSIGEVIWSAEFEGTVKRTERTHIRLFMYPALLADDALPCPQEGQGLGWFTAEEMNGLHLAPGNQKAFNAIWDYFERITNEI
jgi:8-oxo-dGTP diphosphatase